MKYIKLHSYMSVHTLPTICLLDREFVVKRKDILVGKP